MNGYVARCSPPVTLGIAIEGVAFMSHISRKIIAPVILLVTTGLVAVSPSILAQPPEPDQKKGFGKGFEQGGKGINKGGVKGMNKGRGPDYPIEEAPAPTPVEPIKKLEADLAKLKAQEADILTQLQKLKEAPVAPTPIPPADRPGIRGPSGQGGFGGGQGGQGFGPGFPGGQGGFGGGQGGQGFGPGFPGGQGGFGGGQGGQGFGPGFPGGQGGFGGGGAGGQPFGQGFPGGGGVRRLPPGVAQGIAQAFSFMTPGQLNELIGELEKVRTEKINPPPPAPSQNEEILKKLDKLSQELDEIRKSVKK
jgi:hypothetical protein